MGAALLCLHTLSPSFSILISLIFLLVHRSLTSDIEQHSDKHKSIFSGSWSVLIEKDVRAAQSSALVWLHSAHPATLGHMERQTAVVKYEFWGTKSTETKLSLCYLVLTQRNSVLFLAVKVSVTLVLDLNLFRDIGVRIECTVLKSQYWLSQQPKLFLFSVLFPLSPLQISGNLTVPWITGCSRKRAVSTFPSKYLMYQVKQWKVGKKAFLKMSVLFTLGRFFFPLIQTSSAGAVFQLRGSWCL